MGEMNEIIREWYAEMGRKGGSKRISNPRRFEFAKRGAQARWRNHVKAQKKCKVVNKPDIPS